MSLVDLDDAFPCGIEVGLRLREQHRRTQLDGSLQELDLGRAQLGRRVGHQDEAVGEREERQRCRRVAGAETTHARCVHERETLTEDRARRGDLDPLDLLLVPGVAPFGHPSAELGDGDLIGHGLVALAAAHDRGRCLAVAHERDRRGREVVVDGAHIGAQQAVDEGALALLELPDDAHDRRGPVQPRARGRRVPDEVLTAERPQHADQLADDAVERRRLWLGDGGSHSRPSNMLSKESSI